MIYFTFVETKIGRIGIAEENSFLTHLFFGSERILADAIEKRSPFLRHVTEEIGEYLDGERKKFDIPLKPAGTGFQRSVWRALLSIPYGKISTYQKIAEQVGNPKACRAVGMANHRNPIAIIIPCHRVIGSNGSLTGFGGGLPLKQKLLELEKAASNA